MSFSFPSHRLPPAALLLPRTVIALAAVALVTVLVVQARAIRDIRESAAVVTIPHDARDSVPSAKVDKPGEVLTRLAHSDLFGHFDPAMAAADNGNKAARKPPAAELGDKAPDPLPEATLALKLQGIVYKKDPAKRRAIIAGDGPNPEARKIGETLLGDAVIRYIEARRVVVEQQGQLKALTLLDPSIGSGSAGVGEGNTAPLPGSVPPAYVVQPMQAVRRSVMEGVLHQPQSYVPPATQYEPPAEDAPVEDPPPPDDAGEPDQSEPTE